MRFDYTRAAESARRMLERYGREMVLRKARAGDYDPQTSTAQPGKQDFTATGVKLNYEQSDVDGTVIRQGDQRILLAPELLMDPQSGDHILIDQEVWVVMSNSPLRPTDTTIIHDLQVRGIAAIAAQSAARVIEDAA